MPADNLVSALIDLEKTRDAARLREALQALSDLLQVQRDDHLTQAFVTWLHQGLRVAGPLPAGEGDPLTQLQETQTMLEENVRDWTREWLEQGRAQGRAQDIKQGRHEERALLCRQAARKFDAVAAEGLAAALAGVTDPDRLAWVGDWIIECATASELLARVAATTGRAVEAQIIPASPPASGCSRTGSGASGAAGSSSSTPPRSSTLFRRAGGNSTILCVNALISSSSRP